MITLSQVKRQRNCTNRELTAVDAIIVILVVLVSQPVELVSMIVEVDAQHVTLHAILVITLSTQSVLVVFPILQIQPQRTTCSLIILIFLDIQ